MGFVGFTLLLYRVTTSTVSRNGPRRSDSSGRNLRPSLPVDLHYLLTPWAPEPEKQQRMLGLALRILNDTPILPAGFINDCTPEGDVLWPDEAVEIADDPLSLSDFITLWDKLTPHMRTSAAYVVRMVYIDSAEPVAAGIPVQTREFQVGSGGSQ